MGSIDKFYSIFEKDKLNDALSSIVDKKVDATWIGLAMSSVSAGTILTGNILKITQLNTIQTEIPVALLVGTLIVFILFGVSVTWLVVSFNKWYKNRMYTIEEFKEEISEAEIDHEHNYVFLIRGSIDKNQALLFLKKPKWGYMLPYVKSEKNQHLEFLEDKASKIFKGYKVKVNVLEDLYLQNVIKKKPDEGYTKFSYTFGHCEIQTDYEAFKNIIESSVEPHNYSFRSINEVKDDLSTMKSNSDIVNYLLEENLFDTDTSFSPKPDNNVPANLKVIWNITDQCSFDCDFCATKRNTKLEDELSFEDRIKIAEELKKIDGLRLDFAGGDPLYDKEARKAIKHISTYMIKDNRELTAA